MSNFLFWVFLLAVNSWAMVDSLSRGQNAMACLSAFALGFITFGIFIKYRS